MRAIKYAQIRKMDISNGEGVGVSLFVQGCPFHCTNCFNRETWDYDKGKEWTEDIKSTFLKLIDKSYVTRVSLLGGEPLYTQNLDGILDLCETIKVKYPDKLIWLYSGYKYEDLFNPIPDVHKRQEILKYVDVMVDGRFIEELKDMNLKFRGSLNQRIINVPKSLNTGKVVLWDN